MGYQSVAAYVELSEDVHRDSSPRALVDAALNRWRTEEIDSPAEPLIGELVSLKPTSQGAAYHADPAAFSSGLEDQSPPTLIIPIYDRTKVESGSLRFVLPPDVLSSPADATASVHSMLMARLQSAIRYGSVKIEGLPVPRFELEESAEEPNLRYQLIRDNGYGHITVIDERETEAKALKLAETLMLEDPDLDEIGLQKIFAPVKDRALFKLRRVEETESREVEVSFGLEVPVRGSVLTGWTVVFDTHS